MSEAFEITFEKKPNMSLLPTATWTDAEGALKIPCAKCPTVAKIRWNGTSTMILITKCANCADSIIWHWKDCFRCKLGVAFRGGIEQSLYCPKCGTCVHRVKKSVLQYLWIFPALGLLGRAISGMLGPSSSQTSRGSCGTPSYGVNGEYLDFTNGTIAPAKTPVWFESLPSEFHQLIKAKLNPAQQSQIKGVVNLHPDSFQSWTDSDWVCKMGEYKNRMYEFALSHQLNKLGKSALEAGNISDAETAYTLSLALQPGLPTTQDPNYDAHGQLAKLYSAAGKKKLAQEHASMALEQFRLNEKNSLAVSEKVDADTRKSLAEYQKKHAAEYAPVLKQWQALANAN